MVRAVRILGCLGKLKWAMSQAGQRTRKKSAFMLHVSSSGESALTDGVSLAHFFNV